MNTEQQQSHLTSASGGDASKTALPADGGPAFPVGTPAAKWDSERIDESSGNVIPAHWSVDPSLGGMTLRDYFAAKAMHGLIVNTVKVNDDKPPYPASVELARSYADASYLFADAMLEARGRAPAASGSDLLAALQEIAREDAGGFYAAIANKALAKAGVTP